MTAVGVTVAPAANAAPQFQTLTVLNGGHNLAVNATGSLIATSPQSTDARQQWELLFPASAGSSEPTFGSAFQLRNKKTGSCAQDQGRPGSQVIETICLLNPGPKSPQLWQHHTTVDRTVNGKRYQFIFNRNTKRVLHRAPGFEPTVPLLSSVKEINEGSSAAAAQLWTLTKL